MRQGSLRLGRILGIDVAADLGVIVIGGLLTWSLATVILPQGEPGLATAAYWSVAAIGALLFLGSLLAHELGHSVVARRNGIEVEGVTLWLFGGVARFRNEAPGAGAEFRIAAAGPAMSFLLGAVFLAGAYGLDIVGVPGLYVVLLWWLGAINVFLALFNLLPGAPLDGGRILASGLWKLRGDRLWAKATAAKAGRFVGFLLIGAGLAEIALLGSFGGIWTAFIGWFLLGAARMEQAHYDGERLLGDLTVGAAMLPSPRTVANWTTVAEVVDGPLRSTAQQAVPVLDVSGRLVGLVTMTQIKRVPAESWPSTAVAAVMVPVADVPVAAPGEKVTEVIERLGPVATSEVVVLDQGRLVGLMGPAEVQRALALGRMARGRRGAQVPADQHTPAGPPPPPPTVPVQHWDPPMANR
ncbi:MAG: site-2 protease family protein [Microthrixaceae bacterium]